MNSRERIKCVLAAEVPDRLSFRLKTTPESQQIIEDYLGLMGDALLYLAHSTAKVLVSIITPALAAQ